jgi:hypothetical protein
MNSVVVFKLIVTDSTTGETQLVTRECTDRVKGKATMDLLIEKAYLTGKPIEVHFENEYDLKIEEDKGDE